MMERVLPGSVTLVLWAFGVPHGVPRRVRELPENPRPLAARRGSACCVSMAPDADRRDARRYPRSRSRGSFARLRPAARSALRGRTQFREIERSRPDRASSRGAGQLVMLDFTAEWCVSCKEMKRTFPDSG